MNVDKARNDYLVTTIDNVFVCFLGRVLVHWPDAKNLLVEADVTILDYAIANINISIFNYCLHSGHLTVFKPLAASSSTITVTLEWFRRILAGNSSLTGPLIILSIASALF